MLPELRHELEKHAGWCTVQMLVLWTSAGEHRAGAMGGAAPPSDMNMISSNSPAVSGSGCSRAHRMVAWQQHTAVSVPARQEQRASKSSCHVAVFHVTTFWLASEKMHASRVNALR